MRSPRTRSQQVGLTEGGGATYLETAGESTPYPPLPPASDGVEYCPFYAGYLKDLSDGEPAEAAPFGVTSQGS